VRRDADALEGWSVTLALLAKTERIEIGSLRLVHFWNAARLAQSAATAERLAPGRLRFFISIGAHPDDVRFGLPFPPAAERIVWLEEMLTALRALWRGEEVSCSGRFVRLAGARVRPLPRGGRLPIQVAAAGRRMLELVAAHADVWDVNLPPVKARVQAAARDLDAACRARGRDPASLERSMWIFTRLGAGPDDPALRAEFRRLNPWFHAVGDGELVEALVAGTAQECRARLAAIRRELRIDLPVLDLSGVPADAARRVMEALAPLENDVDSYS
jgi:alkanesulfonate monooxygenase SsuD/methylene tetrahydromethanopterin reductase-like flavin-dependent oxidoreductase (luciferase family)